MEMDSLQRMRFRNLGRGHVSSSGLCVVTFTKTGRTGAVQQDVLHLSYLKKATVKTKDAPSQKLHSTNLSQGPGLP